MITNNPDDWRNFKNFRNNLTRLIEKAKTKFYSDKFSYSNDKWQTLKKVTESKKNTSPINIIYNNLSIISPKHIANIANEYFIKKINTIQNYFLNLNVCPMEILKFLIPRNQNIFSIPNISIKETISLINQLKSSNSTGHDDISSKN